MAGFINNQYFSNSSTHSSAFSIGKSLDYTKKKLDERMDLVENIVENTSFFEDYFSDNFKVSLSQKDPLSEDIAVCKTLETMANYLLNSEEVVAQDRAEKEFTYHKSRDKFNNKIKREKAWTVKDGQMMNLVEDENFVEQSIAEKNSRNQKLKKNVTITKKDLEEDSELGQILREYNKLYEFCSAKLKEAPDKNWRLYSNAKYSVMQDMIYSKIALKGIWGPEYFLPSSRKVRNYDIFDFTDYKTVRYLLEQKPDLENDPEMWHILLDFNRLVEKCDFTDEEKAVLILLQDGWTIVEMANYLPIKYARIKQTVIRNIVLKVVRQGDKYDAKDKKIWYQLETRRGNDKEL